MSKVVFVPAFTREAKRLLKKYPSLAADLQALFQRLVTDPTYGISLGRNCYKIRLKIASKSTGSRGGARVVTCVMAVEDSVYLLSIFDKSEQDTISDRRLKELLQLLPPEGSL